MAQVALRFYFTTIQGSGARSAGEELCFCEGPCSIWARCGFAVLSRPCSIFTHILGAFIEHPTTKAVLVVHTMAGACSSL